MTADAQTPIPGIDAGSAVAGTALPDFGFHRARVRCLVCHEVCAWEDSIGWVLHPTENEAGNAIYGRACRTHEP